MFRRDSLSTNINKNLKWYERRWLLIFLILASIGSLISLFDEKNISYLFSFIIYSGLAIVVYSRRKNSIESINKKIKQETHKKNITQPIQTVTYVEPKEKYVEDNLKIDKDQALKYSRVRKLLPDFTVIDFETTGLSADRDKIIQVAAVKYKDFEKVNEYVTYVNPQIKIPPYITKINGISDKDVKNAPTIKEVLPDLLEFLGDSLVVAHNASFDMKFLLTNMYNHGFEYKRFRVIDTLSLARKYIDSTRNYKLETLKEFLHMEHLSSHDALHDCYVTAELYKYCYNKSLIIAKNK